MKKPEKPNEVDLPKKEIPDPSLKERIEILREQNEFDKGAGKEEIEKPEMPVQPNEKPEVQHPPKPDETQPAPGK